MKRVSVKVDCPDCSCGERTCGQCNGSACDRGGAAPHDHVSMRTACPACGGEGVIKCGSCTDGNKTHTAEIDEDWCESLTEIASLLGWLIEHEGYTAEQLIPVVEEPWKWETEYAAMSLGLNEIELAR